jgi:hypothetical protein
MAQGRKPQAAAAPAEVILNNDALAEAGRALSTLSAEALAIQKQFGLESMDPGTLEAEIGVWVEHSGRAMYMIGARLVALRTLSAQGEWLQRLHRLGFEPRMAQRIMSATIKCVDSAGRVRDNLLQLSRSKLLEMVTLDDAQLDVLESGGKLSTLAMGLDEIDRLSVSELKARLRDTEGVVAAKQKVIEKKSSAINDLTEALHRPFKPSADSAAQTAEEQALLEHVRDCVTAAETALMQLVPLAQRAMDGTLSESCATAGRQSIEYLAQRTADIFTSSGITVDFEQRLLPAWLDKAKTKAKAHPKAGH